MTTAKKTKKPPVLDTSVADVETVLFIPDCHHPGVHKPSWELLLRVMEQVKFDNMVALGDFINMGSLSSHHKRLPELAMRLLDETDAANDALDQLDKFDVRRKIYIRGNHEDWMDQFLANNPALIGSLSLEQSLKLKERGWQDVPYRSETKIGKLWLTHDLDNCGVNAHRQAMNKLGASSVIGHTHRMGYEVRGRITGKPMVSAMFGWLGDANKITYRSRGSVTHEHALGFGVGLKEPNGVVHLEPCPIVNGSVKVFGKIYR